MAKVKIIDTNDIPLCPHCSAELRFIKRVAKGSIFETKEIYICPSCKKVLSIRW